MQRESQPRRSSTGATRSRGRQSRAGGLSGLERQLLRWRIHFGSSRVAFRLGRSLLLFITGVLLVGSSAMVDPALHRGVETGAAAPVTVQNTGRELAINVDLTRFDRSQLDAVLGTLQSSGFVYIRQPVSWASIEPTQGTFDWSGLDAVINGAEAHGMHVIVTVENTPGWARRASELNYADAPPSDASTLADFTSALANRYGAKLLFFQFYDRPNLPERWGGATPSPGEYVELLAAAYNAVRGTNSDAKVILAEIDSRGMGSVPGDDLHYIQQVYDVGGAAFFDVVAIQLDGGSRARP